MCLSNGAVAVTCCCPWSTSGHLRAGPGQGGTALWAAGRAGQGFRGRARKCGSGNEAERLASLRTVSVTLLEGEGRQGRPGGGLRTGLCPVGCCII